LESNVVRGSGKSKFQKGIFPENGSHPPKGNGGIPDFPKKPQETVIFFDNGVEIRMKLWQITTCKYF
jgi:hypothetical protein